MVPQHSDLARTGLSQTLDAESDAVGCIDAADAQLAQVADFIAGVPDDLYARPCGSVMGSTLGQHLRHVLDHYSAALRPGTTIDYDHRERDTPMEVSRNVAINAVREVRDSLATFAPAALGQSVSVRVMLTQCGRCADVSSTLGREIAFANHHALHHHAMMKLIADAFGVSSPPGFGKAPSTLHHERANEASGR